jgi:pyrroloquinoline quinone biosynthesis protein D
MPRPSDTSRPKFAAGCRWGTHGEDRVVLFPEGMIRVQATGLSILELVDGQHEVGQIISLLAKRYDKADPVNVREDVLSFLEKLHDKRVVDF